MQKENMVMFRVSAYKCKNPQQLWKDIKPTNCINSKWIPQTIGDQIWMWFEFANKEDKQKYIDWINGCEVSCEIAWVLNDGITIAYPKDMMCQDEDNWTQEEINRWCS